MPGHGGGATIHPYACVAYLSVVTLDHLSAGSAKNSGSCESRRTRPYRRTRRAAVVRVCPVGVLRGSRAAIPAGGGVGGEGGASGSGPAGPGARRGGVGSLLDILGLLDLLRALGGCCATHTTERGDSPALPRKSGRGERRAGADRGRVGLGEGRRTGRYPPTQRKLAPPPPSRCRSAAPAAPFSAAREAPRGAVSRWRGHAGEKVHA